MKLQMKENVFKIVPYTFTVYEFNRTIIGSKLWNNELSAQLYWMLRNVFSGSSQLSKFMFLFYNKNDKSFACEMTFILFYLLHGR